MIFVTSLCIEREEKSWENACISIIPWGTIPFRSFLFKDFCCFPQKFFFLRDLREKLWTP